MKIGAIIIVNLTSPKQTFVGRLMDLQPAGITVRGIDMVAFEDWMNNISTHEESGVQPTTSFFPLHRVEKMILDESVGAVPSLSHTFLAKVGSSIEDHLE